MILENIKKILEQLQQGEFLAGMEEFYSADVINIEPTGVTIEGKRAIIEHEKKVLEGVSQFHGAEIYSVGVGEDDGNGNGVTYAEYSLAVDMKDGSKFNPKQVQVTRWVDGLAKENRFYYNPNFN